MYSSPKEKEPTQTWGPWHALAEAGLAIDALKEKTQIKDETILKAILVEIINEELMQWNADQEKRAGEEQAILTETQKTLEEILKATNIYDVGHATHNEVMKELKRFMHHYASKSAEK